MAEAVPFEGVEKRLVVQFTPEHVAKNNGIDPVSGFEGELAGAVRSPLSMTVEEWSEILDEAGCTIVSVKELLDHRVYLLSESTLTVWDTGFLMKTCGRTTPFLALRTILSKYICLCAGQGGSPAKTPEGPNTSLGCSTEHEHHQHSCSGRTPQFAQCRDLEGLCSKRFQQVVNWMTYSRIEFIHPEFQVWPHQNFDQERHFLQRLFNLNPPHGDDETTTTTRQNEDFEGRKSLLQGQQRQQRRLTFLSLPAGANTMHTAFYANGERCARTYHMEEALMVGVDIDCVRNLTGADHMAEREQQLATRTVAYSPMEDAILGYQEEQGAASGLVGSQRRHLDQFWFHPCGYSCNALMLQDPNSSSSANDGRVQYFSCHISPEAQTSYASFELGRERQGDRSAVDLGPLISCIRPEHLQLTRITVDDADSVCHVDGSTAGAAATDIPHTVEHGGCRLRVSHTYVPWRASSAFESASSASSAESSAITDSEEEAAASAAAQQTSNRCFGVLEDCSVPQESVV